jgi:uroporphyrinogen-III synthase
LRAIGAEVDAPLAYRTIAVNDAAERIRQGGLDVVTLCSPSAVRSVAASLDSKSVVVCLGETTAATARQLGLRVDAVASSTSMASLVEAVAAALVGVRV